MKVTVCQLRNDSRDLLLDWDELIEHTQKEKSEFVVLPEMPFYSWLGSFDKFDDEIWDEALKAHDFWIKNKLTELHAKTIVTSRPISEGSARFNEGFVWDHEHGYQPIHRKYYLPNEKWFMEPVWTQRGKLDFTSHNCHDDVKTGIMICTDLWFTEHARKYGREGIHILSCPRATPAYDGTIFPDDYCDSWIAGGKSAAIVSGSYCLSSNRGGIDSNNLPWEGKSWIISPYGRLLALTDENNKYITLDIDIKIAENAKSTYPRYVIE
ncbi:MAG TPA: carbon-nitrogen hydrolase family protein [Victivallales bacterium]|nr:carbon-nitrogen hydrolase family protein [Victivallales bacterium]